MICRRNRKTPDMTEIFTTGPHQCGDYDTRVSIRPISLSTDDLIFYCTLRNVYGIFASLIAVLGIAGNVISLVILPMTGGARSAIVFLQSLGVYDTVFLVTILLLKTLPSISIIGHYGVVMSNAMSPALFPLLYIAHIGAIYSTICISSERSEHFTLTAFFVFFFFFFFFFLSPSFCFTVCVSVSLCLCLFVSLCLCLSASVCLSVCLSV